MIHDSFQTFLEFNKSLDGKEVQLFSPLVLLFFVVGGYVFIQLLVATEKVKRGRETHMNAGKGLAWVVVVLFIFLGIVLGGK